MRPLGALVLMSSLAAALALGGPGCKKSSSSGGGKKAGGGASILSVLPPDGPLPGGTLTVITTSGFPDDFQIDAPTILFGTQVATIAATPSSWRVQVFVPAGIVTGPVDVTVDAVSGTSVIAPSGYSYLPVGCKLFSVCPTLGDPAGGTIATILGDGFQNPSAVDFGGTPSPRVTWVSAQELLAEIPAGALAGPVAVTVIDAFGSCTMSSAFTYVSSPLSPDGYEPNDDGRGCSAIALPISEPGLTIHDTVDEDFFCFTVTGRGATITVTPDPTSGNLDLELYEAARGQLVSRSDNPSGPESITTPGAGDFYVRVYGDCGAFGTYDLDSR